MTNSTEGRGGERPGQDQPGSPSLPPKLQEAAQALQAGEPAVLTGEHGSELVAAGESITADVVNRMLAIGMGLIRIALPDSRCEQLGISLQRGSTSSHLRHGVLIEAREGVGSGISAADRARTIRVASDPRTTAGDLVIPGHVVPVPARDRGTLAMPGEPEAATDLMALAGLERAAVMCQVLDDQGSVAESEHVGAVAASEGLTQVSIAEIVDHRRSTPGALILEDLSVAKVLGATVVTYEYRDSDSGARHQVTVRGEGTAPDIAGSYELVGEQRGGDEGDPGDPGGAMIRLATDPHLGALVWLGTGDGGNGGEVSPDAADAGAGELARRLIEAVGRDADAGITSTEGTDMIGDG